jgi:small subunit ribosomal protein S1
VVEARVLDVNRGGVVVDFGNRAFVPISQLVSVQRVGETEEEQEQLVEQLKGLVGKRLKLKVIEADRKRNRLILSERQANRELRSQRRDTLLQELEPGQIRRGRVSNIANFGVFVDLGGADGLVHISELSWSRVKHPSEVVKPGQEVEVFVISVDRETKKIALSLRRAQEDPWMTIEERYPLNSIVTGEVIKQAQFGVFVKIEDGVEGLVHNSEIAPSDRRLLQEGRTLPFRVISIDLDRRRLRLSPAPDEIVQPAEATPEPEPTTEAQEPATTEPQT